MSDGRRKTRPRSNAGLGIYEKVVNWVFSDLRVYYRDTSVAIDVPATYHVGMTFRAGFFIDATPLLLRPVHRIRYLLASSHAAQLYYIDDLCIANPDVRRWKLCTFHYNSYFKVVDIYERGDIVQVFLLHIPPMAAYLFVNDALDINFATFSHNGTPLVEMARHDLDEKGTMGVHQRSYDKAFVNRMHDPVGLDANDHLCPFAVSDTPPTEKIASMGSMVHQLADDGDIDIYSAREE